MGNLNKKPGQGKTPQQYRDSSRFAWYGVVGMILLLLFMSACQTSIKKLGGAKYLSYLDVILIIKIKIMRKYIRALEVPFYLLVIALACLERGSTGVAVFLLLISVGRLVVNVMTDEFIYKK